MQGNTHSAAGLGAGIAVGGALMTNDVGFHLAIGNINAVVAPTEQTPGRGYYYLLFGAFVVASVVGSLLPDIDHPQSTMTKRHRIITAPYRILAKVASLIKIKGLEHRGICHSWIIPAILAILIWRVIALAELKFVVIGLLVGYLSHLLLDMFNPAGVPLFWPNRNKIRLLPKKLCIVTGSPSELVIRILIYVVNAGLIIGCLKMFGLLNMW